MSTSSRIWDFGMKFSETLVFIEVSDSESSLIVRLLRV